MAGDVSAGAINPFQVRVLKPGKPDSAIVATCGNCATRLLLDTPIIRILPPLTCGNSSEKFPKYICTLPPNRSVTAGAPPL